METVRRRWGGAGPASSLREQRQASGAGRGQQWGGGALLVDSRLQHQRRGCPGNTLVGHTARQGWGEGGWERWRLDRVGTKTNRMATVLTSG